MSEALHSTIHRRVGWLAIRQLGTVAAVVAALLPLAHTSTAHADPPPPCAPGSTITCQSPDGRTIPSLPDFQVQEQDDWRVDHLDPNSLSPLTTPQKLATVTGEDVDVYNAKNEPDGAGQVVGMLRVGTQVQPMGSCAPESWCQVTLPNGSAGWVWGHLQLP